MLRLTKEVTYDTPLMAQTTSKNVCRSKLHITINEKCIQKCSNVLFTGKDVYSFKLVGVPCMQTIHEDDDFGINKIHHNISNADSKCISKINNDQK